MQIIAKNQRRLHLPLIALAGGLIALVGAGCASEDDLGFEDFDNLRGATYTTHGEEDSTTAHGADSTTCDTDSTTHAGEDTAPPPAGECETAFAYGHGKATCFLDMDVQGNRWGWSMHVHPGTMTEWPLYAGAGQCNLDNGANVGSVWVDYDGSTLVVTVDPACGYDDAEVHIYVGSDPLPEGNNGHPTTAPGQYTEVDEHPDGSPYVFHGLSGHVYVIVHAVICEHDHHGACT